MRDESKRWIWDGVPALDPFWRVIQGVTSAMRNSGTIVDEQTFEFVTELEIHKASRLQYPVSLLALRPEPEGKKPPPGPLTEQFAQVISRVIRSTDLVRLRSASCTLHVLLVGAYWEDLPSVIQRIVEEVRRHRLQIEGGRRPVALSVGAACFPTTATTVQGLSAQADNLARQDRQEHTLDPSCPLP